MDIKELKRMLKNSATILILDNGEPSFVVLNYGMYKDMIERSIPANGPAAAKLQGIQAPQNSVSGEQPAGESELLERINNEIQVLKEEIEKEEQALAVE